MFDKAFIRKFVCAVNNYSFKKFINSTECSMSLPSKVGYRSGFGKIILNSGSATLLFYFVRDVYSRGQNVKNRYLLQYTAKTKTQYRKFETNIPRKELRGYSPNCYIHVSVRNLYIPLIGLYLFCCSKQVDRTWEDMDRLQTDECGNWDWGRTIPFMGIHKIKFICSAPPVWRYFKNNTAQVDVLWLLLHPIWAPVLCRQEIRGKQRDWRRCVHLYSGELNL